ncbi:2-hydroxychromene-2-carboxylate isomerase [Variovorax sp. M-6]|uniref:2-hydroxychromene-2-carboxylate isomerase n=1 Tax=Variovorax sp. M-6 TaxID=3233041 RepID=UPI003F964BB5
MSEQAPIDFWFDFASPYGYLMSEKIDALAERHGRRVRWRPVLLFAVLRALDLPAPMAHEAKRAYMWHDFERSARFLGVPLRLPAGFPTIAPHAARAFHLVDRIDAAGAVRFAQAAMRGYFRDAAPLDNAGQVARWACDAVPAVGDAAHFEMLLAGDEAKDLLRQEVDTAVRERVFGSPFVVIDGEAFFGVDRLPQIDAWLDGRLSFAEPRQGA